MATIGIMAAFHTTPHIKKALMSLQTNASFIYFSYKNLSEIKTIYQQYRHDIDGWVFGGIIPKLYFEQNIGPLPKPSVFVDLSEKDFYKTLLTCTFERSFEMKRTVIDFLNKENDYMNLKSFVPSDDFPLYYSDSLFQDVNDQMYEKLIAFHRHAHMDGAQLSITRFSNILPVLQKDGIPTLFLAPSTSSIHKQVETLLLQLETQELADKQIAIGYLTFKAKTEIEKIKLHHALLSYSEMEGEPLLVHANETSFELVTSFGDLERLTNSFQQCALSAYLKGKHPKIMFQLGWGAGKTLHEARTNAKTANKQQKRIGCPYILTESTLLGPLGDGKRLELQLDPLQLQKWSKQTGVSVLQLQKILAIPAKTKRHDVCANDLALHLGITTRSANRILKKLEQGQAAEETTVRQEKLRGRPRKRYRLLFN